MRCSHLCVRWKELGYLTGTDQNLSNRVNRSAVLSDQESVLTAPHDLTPELRLISRSDDEPGKTVYFLTGAIMACGGLMLSRRFHSDGSAALECEFPRAICVDMYAVLLTAGLRLSRNSHLKMAELCRCTHALPRNFEKQVVTLEIDVLPPGEENSAAKQPLEQQTM